MCPAGTHLCTTIISLCVHPILWRILLPCMGSTVATLLGHLQLCLFKWLWRLTHAHVVVPCSRSTHLVPESVIQRAVCSRALQAQKQKRQYIVIAFMHIGLSNKKQNKHFGQPKLRLKAIEVAQRFNIFVCICSHKL